MPRSSAIASSMSSTSRQMWNSPSPCSAIQRLVPCRVCPTATALDRSRRSETWRGRCRARADAPRTPSRCRACSRTRPSAPCMLLTAMAMCSMRLIFMGGSRRLGARDLDWPDASLALLQDHGGGLLGDHEGRRVGVARGDGRHDRGIGDAQALEAAHPSARRPRPSSSPPILQVPTGWKMVVPMSPAAFASSSSLWNSGPGRNSSGRYLASAGGDDDVAGDADGVGRHLPVVGGGEVVRPDLGMRRGSGAVMRTQPRLVGRRLATLAVKAGNGSSGSPNLGSVSGCMWYWRLGVSRPGRTCEGAELRGRHGHRPALHQEILERQAGALQQAR